MNAGITPHVKIEQHPNPKRRSYHFACEVSTSKHMYGFGRDSLMVMFDERDPGEESKKLAERLANLPGVTDGHFKQYEVSIGIGDAFSWKDIGPLVLGELVKTFYPDAIGKTLNISSTIGWSYYVRPSSHGFMGDDDDGHRIHYQEMTDHEPVEVKEVNFGAGRPILDVEHLFGKEALQEAKAKKAAETIDVA